MDKVEAETVELTSAVETARQELERWQVGAAGEGQEFKQLKTWADLYDNCSFAAKKMIVSQFIKAVYVYRDYTLEVEFNVSFDEFQTLAAETRNLGNDKADILAKSVKKTGLPKQVCLCNIETLCMPSSGGRAKWRVTSVLPQAKPWRRADLFRPSKVNKSNKSPATQVTC